MNDGILLKSIDMGLHQPVQDVELAGRKLHWDAPELVVKDGSGKKFSKQTDAYGFGMLVRNASPQATVEECQKCRCKETKTEKGHLFALFYQETTRPLMMS